MNWLAHLLLSEPNPAFRLGNLLPDLGQSRLLVNLPAEIQRGVRQHRQIDAYTDSHPVFRRSVRRLEPPFRRYGGILVDVFYDHFLARDWPAYSATPLPSFAAEVYGSFDLHWNDIPAEIRPRLEQLRIEDLLCSYREVSGIAEALRRISKRLRRPFDLSAAVAILELHDEAFSADFQEFFPDLQARVRMG